MRYDTAAVSASDAFAFWHGAVCDSFVQLGCDTNRAQGFRGAIDVDRHPLLRVSRVKARQHAVERRPRDIRAASEDFFLVSLQIRNTVRLIQSERAALIGPGDMGLYDSTLPYRLELPDGFEQIVLQMPKDRLLAQFPGARSMLAVRLGGDSPLGRLIGGTIVSLTAQLRTADATTAALIEDTILDLVATRLADARGQAAELSSPEQITLLRAKSFIRRNLGDPDLDRAAVAAAAGLSVRRLNAIFAKDDMSLSRYIRTERLKAVAANLRAPGHAQRTISEIAFAHGFSNLQHFSTLFRRSYGQSPSDYRASGGREIG